MNNIEYMKFVVETTPETSGLVSRIIYMGLGGRCVWSACRLPENYGSVIKIPKQAETDRKYNTIICFDKDLFKNRKGITDIILQSNIHRILEGSFEGCSDLQRIYIPRTVSSIGEGAFIGCEKLEEIYYEGSASEWDSINLHLYKRHVQLDGKCHQGRPVERIIDDYRSINDGAEPLIKAKIHYNCR